MTHTYTHCKLISILEFEIKALTSFKLAQWGTNLGQKCGNKNAKEERPITFHYKTSFLKCALKTIIEGDTMHLLRYL